MIHHISLSPAEIDIRDSFQLARKEVQRLKDELAQLRRKVQQSDSTLAEQVVALRATSEQLAAAEEKMSINRMSCRRLLRALPNWKKKCAVASINQKITVEP